MPDEHDAEKSEEIPESPLHAYKEGREEELEDDPTLRGEPPENSPKRDGDAEGQTRTGYPSKEGSG